MVKLRRISVVERYILDSNDLTLESKKDLDDLKDHLGDDLFNDYMGIRNKITDPEYKDFGKLKKKDIKDIKDYIDTFQSNTDKRKLDKDLGAVEIYEDSDWVVYKITTYVAAKYYGSNTKWCISSNTVGNSWFHKYIDDKNLDGGYYFYLSKKDPKEKYCVLQTKDKKIVGIFDSSDTEFLSYGDLDVDLPVVKQVNLSKVSLGDIIKDVKNRDYTKLKKDLDHCSIDINRDSDSLGNIIPRFLPSLLKIGDAKLLDIFLDHGLNPNIIIDNNTGYALFKAVDDGDIDIIKIMLDHGANPNLARILSGARRKNKKDFLEFPLDVAIENNRQDIVDLLRQYGARG